MNVLGGGDFERDFLELIKLRCHVRYRTWNFRATRFPKPVIKIDVGIWAFLNFALFGFYGDGNWISFSKQFGDTKLQKQLSRLRSGVGNQIFDRHVCCSWKNVGTRIDPDVSSVPHSSFRTPLLPNQKSLSHVLWSHRYLPIGRWGGRDYLC